MSPLTEGGNAQRKEATMPTGTILLLGAFAGLTIYLGLPLTFLKQTPRSLKVFLNMLTTGVLIFLLFDVLEQGQRAHQYRPGPGPYPPDGSGHIRYAR